MPSQEEAYARLIAGLLSQGATLATMATKVLDGSFLADLVTESANDEEPAEEPSSLLADERVERLTGYIHQLERQLQEAQRQNHSLRTQSRLADVSRRAQCVMCYAEGKGARAATYVACGHSVCEDHVNEVVEGGA